MNTLGVSVYPTKETLQNDLEYLTTCSHFGFKRVFCCFISKVNDDKEELLKMYKKLFDHIQSLGMFAIVDVAPVVFEKFGIGYEDLSFFKRLNITGIRLDEGFDIDTATKMTQNKEGLLIELNASSFNGFIDCLIANGARTDRIVACHNFYPQKYTALSLNHFNKCNKQIAKHNLKISAFVTSNQSTSGPWNVNEGLCTLELHRQMPIDLQARHLYYLGIDEVIIGNAYATCDELKSLSKIDPNTIQLKIIESEGLTDVEREIIYHFPHFVRGDMSEYMVRSTMPRIIFSESSVQPKNCNYLKRGDVVILNDNYGRYKGELHIITKDMENNGNKNVVGRLDENEQCLLSFLSSWKPFTFIQ